LKSVCPFLWHKAMSLKSTPVPASTASASDALQSPLHTKRLAATQAFFH
jgi:hypothetical protein